MFTCAGLVGFYVFTYARLVGFKLVTCAGLVGFKVFTCAGLVGFKVFTCAGLVGFAAFLTDEEFGRLTDSDVSENVFLHQPHRSTEIGKIRGQKPTAMGVIVGSKIVNLKCHKRTKLLHCLTLL